MRAPVSPCLSLLILALFCSCHRTIHARPFFRVLFMLDRCCSSCCSPFCLSSSPLARSQYPCLAQPALCTLVSAIVSPSCHRAIHIVRVPELLKRYRLPFCLRHPPSSSVFLSRSFLPLRLCAHKPPETTTTKRRSRLPSSIIHVVVHPFHSSTVSYHHNPTLQRESADKKNRNPPRYKE